MAGGWSFQFRDLPEPEPGKNLILEIQLPAEVSQQRPKTPRGISQIVELISRLCLRVFVVRDRFEVIRMIDSQLSSRSSNDN
jgi:hypothetical protein